MPKGDRSKKKEKDGSQRVADTTLPPDEDNESVDSSQEGSVVSEEGTEKQDTEEQLAFLFGEAVEQLLEKSGQARLSALARLNKLCSENVLSAQLAGRVETVTDTIVKGLKKGNECVELLHFALLLTVQLGEAQEPWASLHPLLNQLCADPAASPSERAAACQALGICSLIQAEDPQDLVEVMLQLEKLFHCKDAVIVNAAVKSWSLLLTAAPASIVPTLTSSLVPTLNKLLENGEIEVRIASGQGIALLVNLIHELNGGELLRTPELDKSNYLMQQLATDSSRYTGRKERSQQRSSFKDILQTLESGTVSQQNVRCGHEVIALDNWTKLIRYNSFKELLGTGMNRHLMANDLIREVFELGPPPAIEVESKMAKMERKSLTAARAKHRSQTRGKSRDQKSVAS
eukprot:Em0016g1066a